MKIILEKGQNLFITSDTHYAHKNLCRATTEWSKEGNNTRDFVSLDHMNSTIVNNINEVVGQDDILIHLGDFAFSGIDKIKEFRSRIMCKNIILVYGNHDHNVKNNRDKVQDLFLDTKDYIDLDLTIPNGKSTERHRFILFHFPICSWDGMAKGVTLCHGHVHLPKHLKIGDGKSIDVGMDGNDMKPYRIQEVISLMKNQPIKRLTLPKDHHEN